MPSFLRSRNGWATLDFDLWWFIPIIKHCRGGIRSMWIPPWVQRQGVLNDTRRLRSSTRASEEPKKTATVSMNELKMHPSARRPP